MSRTATTRLSRAAASVIAFQVPSREPSSTSTISAVPPTPSSTAATRRTNSGSTPSSLKQGATTDRNGRASVIARPIAQMRPETNASGLPGDAQAGRHDVAGVAAGQLAIVAQVEAGRLGYRGAG